MGRGRSRIRGKGGEERRRRRRRRNIGGQEM